MNSSSDVLVIGGGAMGLATAIELACQGAQVTVLSRNFQEAALHAAAGMLAPQAEGLEPGPMLDLCLRSRDLYADWTNQLTELTELETGYWPCGIVAPTYADSPARLAQDAEWCDRTTIHQYQPDLGPEVVGGWWFPDDAQVNNQQLAQVLLQAAEHLGVTLREGVTVTALDTKEHRIQHLQTTAGPWQAKTYILATGAWSQELLPIPVIPRKGQLCAVQAQTKPLHKVLFGPGVYIVPRQNGRIVVGATSEDVGFAAYNTPAGMQSLLAAAIRLYPPLADHPLEDCWWGFRPATPDEWPILGHSPYENLILATGHYRNGILLAPITARLISTLVVTGQADPVLQDFSWQRFAPSSPSPARLALAPS
ncbi:glycine oxidase ThiO [Acaryochloris sp. IP29b_bin.148]|uniref:glycine oxidase ThiO n=1 Tax=Acaryochloris sp. IP29b_bin.148 TaxID=2969218 RepID=UPI00260D4998|nr:glycine oxidase ThiO [Acaryochloris sp. IP29b_bin.148]